MLIIAAIILFVGGVYVYRGSTREITESELAEALMKNKTPYIGDNSKAGAIVRLLLAENALPPATIALSTSAQPYGLTVHYQVEAGMEADKYVYFKNAALLFALIGNADFVNQVEGEQGDENAPSVYYTRRQVEAILGEKPGGYGESAEKLGALLRELEDREQFYWQDPLLLSAALFVLGDDYVLTTEKAQVIPNGENVFCVLFPGLNEKTAQIMLRKEEDGSFTLLEPMALFDSRKFAPADEEEMFGWLIGHCEVTDAKTEAALLAFSRFLVENTQNFGGMNPAYVYNGAFFQEATEGDPSTLQLISTDVLGLSYADSLVLDAAGNVQVGPSEPWETQEAAIVADLGDYLLLSRGEREECPTHTGSCGEEYWAKSLCLYNSKDKTETVVLKQQILASFAVKDRENDRVFIEARYDNPHANTGHTLTGYIDLPGTAFVQTGRADRYKN